MKKLLLISSLILLVTGCATKPVNYENAKAAPAKNVYLYQDMAHETQIHVTRDSGYQGNLCAVKFFIDNKLAAKLDTSQRASFYVPAGKHIVAAEHNCSGSKDELRINTTKEAPVNLRISVSISGAKLNETL